MDIRLAGDGTPEGRLAIPVRQLIVRMIQPYPNTPDLADIRDAIRIYVRREILVARMLQESRKTTRDDRVSAMRIELLEVEKEIAEHPL